MAKHDKLDAERNAAKLPDSKFDPKELKKGTDREMEHTESRAEAEKIAKQHLFDNPRYYSELDKAGFEEMELEEKWSAKYKRSIDCNNPKGFSQKAHCQGRKKNMSETIDEGKNKPTNPGLWSRAKSAARSKFKVYPCVTMDSQALTKEGWKYYSELKVGDLILTYNIKENINEWKPIEYLHFYEKAEILNIRKSTTGFNFKCTPDHKWVIRRNKTSDCELVETKNINKHMTIITSAVLKEEAVEPFKLNGFSKYNENWVKNIINMNNEQRMAFFASAIIYDGNHKGFSNKLKRNTYGFSQKNKDHGHALEICATLLGLNVTFYNKKHNTNMTGYTIIEKQSTGTQNLIIENAGFEDVWCPKTENNTWIMKQNKMITITGNSAYANAWASKWYKKHGGGWRKSKKVNEAVNQVNPTSLDKEIYSTSRNTALVSQSERFSPQVNPSGYDALVTRFITSMDKFLIDPKQNKENIGELEKMARILLMNMPQSDEAEAEAMLAKIKGQTQTSAMSGLSEAMFNRATRIKYIAYMMLAFGQIGLEQIAKMPSDIFPKEVINRINTDDDGKTEDSKSLKLKKDDSVATGRPLQEALNNSGILLCECDCGCNECEMSYDAFDINDEVDEEFDEYEFNTEDFGSYLGGNNNKGNPDLDMDGIYSPEELYYHFDLDDDGIVIPDEYEEHVEWHADHPEILQKHKNKLAPAVSMMVKSKWR